MYNYLMSSYYIQCSISSISKPTELIIPEWFVLGSVKIWQRSLKYNVEFNIHILFIIKILISAIFNIKFTVALGWYYFKKLK